MTNTQRWRDITAEEVNVITTIIAKSGLGGCDTLIAELSGAKVSPQTPWIIDIQSSQTTEATSLSDGPFPARAYVPNRNEYRGEVIVWISAGHLSGLEYAWVTDTPPSRWPLSEEMEIIGN